MEGKRMERDVTEFFDVLEWYDTLSESEKESLSEHMSTTYNEYDESELDGLEEVDLSDIT